jgi:hypothetical protein
MAYFVSLKNKNLKSCMKRSNFLTIVLSIFLIVSTTQCSKTDVAAPAITLNTANNGTIGASARELLSAEKPSLVLEINYMPGYKLQSAALTTLNTFLSSYTKKGSYQLIEKEIAASGKDSLSLSEIDHIERKNRTTFNSSSQVSVYVLVTDGKYSPANTLGFAFRNTSVALMGKTIQTFSGGVNQVPRWKLEASTLEHEFGHLFGLVDVGSPMQTNHLDAAHKAHCDNHKCLMYYQTESTQFLGTIMTNNIPPLDANCHNDLIANGGK